MENSLEQFTREDLADMIRDEQASNRSLCQLLVKKTERIAGLEAKLNHIKAGGCCVAHPGETTMECDATKPCVTCRMRAAEDYLAEATRPTTNYCQNCAELAKELAAAEAVIANATRWAKENGDDDYQDILSAHDEGGESDGAD